MIKDRRIRRTQKLLGEALIAVALEKGYKSITIQDVTARADIGYRTFFRHYAGLDDLLVNVAQERLDKLYDMLNLPQADEELDDPIQVFRESGRTLFEHIKNNPTIFRVLLLDDSLQFVLAPVMRQACRKTESMLNVLPQNNISAALAANHIIASAFSLMRWWLENDMPRPPERMGEIFTDLIVKPTWLAMTQE
ncbi:MAG: TetR/AcrR family transcriptional regulator [Anaerolineales bacterium]|nr:TetR/AcrR family transcriptional regulator [Anaerolineales bacterium]